MTEGPRLTWNVSELEGVLGPAKPISDMVFGQGHVFIVPDGGIHEVAVYPAAGMVRVVTTTIEVNLVDVTTPKVSPDQVIFQDDRPEGARHLSVTRSGGIAVLFAPQLPASLQGGFPRS